MITVYRITFNGGYHEVQTLEQAELWRETFAPDGVITVIEKLIQSEE